VIVTARWIVPVLAAGVLTAGGFAVGADRSDPLGASSTMGMAAAACDAMHQSPEMRGMLGRMPTELRQRCQAMHERTTPMMQMMEQMSGLMDGP